MQSFTVPFFDLITLHLLRQAYLKGEEVDDQQIEEKFGLRYVDNCKFFKTYTNFCEEYAKVSDFKLT
jgi:hypothetical protein